MSDLEFFYLVMAVFYLWECTHWLRDTTVAFASWAGESFRISPPFLVVSSRDGGLHLASPLSAGGTFFPVSGWPIAVSPLGAANSMGAVVRFADKPRFSAGRHRLMVDGNRFAVAGSPAHAQGIAETLNRAVATPEGERGDMILDGLKRSLDAPAVAARLDEFARVARLPAIMASLLLLFLFLAGPLVFWQIGFATSWPWLLGGAAILCITNALVFLRAHKRLHPGLEDERFAHLLMVLLFPPAGMRARDMLSRPLLEHVHPLAAARTLCRPDVFERYASRVVRELRYPLVRHVSMGAEATAVWRWFDEHTLAEVDRFVTGHHLSLDRLAAAPARADRDSRSYCPRCHAQFTRAEGRCSDCGVGLAGF